MDDKTKESLNRWWTEYMGGCWHEFTNRINLSGGRIIVRCLKCKGLFSVYTENPDYTARSAFLDIWDKARESEVWNDFWYSFIEKDGLVKTYQRTSNVFSLIDQPTFAEEWAKFCGWKE
jgi:hypothetical protein